MSAPARRLNVDGERLGDDAPERLHRGEHLRISRSVRITFEVDDDELRQVLLPLLHVPVSEPPTVNGKLLTLAEVAERLDISRTKVHQLIARGEISSISMGRI